MGEPAIVHHHSVLAPEVDGGQIASQDLLCFYVIRAPAVHIRGLASSSGALSCGLELWPRLARRVGKRDEEKT